MVINLSAETISTATSALRCSRDTLKATLRRTDLSYDKRVIAEHQLEDVESALSVFRELEDSCISMVIEA